MTAPLTKLAPPGEWHPYYTGMKWLSRWLDGNDRYCRIPIVWPVQFMPADEVIGLESMPEPLLMTRHKAWGPAPYVGSPFVYAWAVGVDNLGRQIASQSRIVYTDPRQP